MGESRTDRITKMESYLDEARQVIDDLDLAITKYTEVQNKIKKLEAYYTGGQWRKDYEADEAGLLPHDLKRGVLSEDGIYNVLERFHELEMEQSTDNAHFIR